MNKTVTPGDLHGELRVLPSKSASHRAVMMAALARGKTLLEPMQLSKDIGATLACAQALGLTRGAAMAAGETEGFVRAEIWGGGEAEKRPLRELDCGESGSTLRFFIPLALDGRGPVRLIGHGRLMQRPLTVYQNLFAPLGVVWRQEGDALTVEGELKSGRFELPGDVSSQFITGLLLALPRLEGDSEIVVTTPLESRAYVELTRRVQREFGVTSAWLDGGQTLLVRGGQEAISPGTLHIEGDWSHAAFYLVAGAIGRGEIRLTGLDPQSAQGDRAVVEILRDMGADIRWEGSALVSRASRLHGLRVDCAQIPDLVPILAVAMAAAEGESRITGAARLRIKESDRLSAMAAALTAAGADAAELPDGLAIRGAMRANFGEHFKLTIFGESHGPAIGVVVDGLPAGARLDEDYIAGQMARRAPGGDPTATARKEADAVRILSGAMNGRATGAPLCAMIENTNTRSGDYAGMAARMRPGHADYAGYVKYRGMNDPRGGGHFSGRLTAPLVFAGSVARLLLREKGIEIGAHIAAIAGERDARFDPVGVDARTLCGLAQSRFPLLNPEKEAPMRRAVAEARAAQDSVGGVIECAAVGVRAGIGSPFFGSVESVVSQLAFSVPAVKAIAFGDGMALAEMRGSEANDAMRMDGDGVTCESNHNGGVTGGITNGMPVIFRAAIKPTPSIARAQRTVDVAKRENAVLEIAGRHDPCIVPRAVVVMESILAIALCELEMDDAAQRALTE